MDVNKWMATFLNTNSINNVSKMFGRKRKKRGMMWVSLVGLGVSAAAATLGMRRNRNKENHSLSRLVENSMRNLSPAKNGQSPNIAAIAAEFSKELTQDNQSHNKE